MSTLNQRSFAGGEIAPSLYARVDTVKYATGLRTMRNFTVMRHGGATNRAGSTFVGEVKDSTKQVRLIEFVFNSDQTYVLELGNLYMRVIRDGAHVLEPTKVITGITSANPAVVSVTTHGYSTGDEIRIEDVVGMTVLNGRNFKVTVLTAGTFSLQYMDGSNVDATGFTAYTSGGTSARVFTLVTPYLEADLPTLNYAQSADVVTIVHPSYAPRDLTRLAHDDWDLDVLDFQPDIASPEGGTFSSVSGGSVKYRWRVTAIDDETGEESLPSPTIGSQMSITSITQANPMVVTVASVPAGAGALIVGDEIYFQNVGGMTQLNGTRHAITGLIGTTLTFGQTDASGYSAYTAGGTAHRTWISATGATATAANPHIVQWDAVVGAREYNVYREVNGVFGFLGIASYNSIGIVGKQQFNDVGIEPDTTDTPPEPRNPFAEAGDFPSAVTYFQQRKAFANTNNDPEKSWLSRSANFKNFTASFPIQADDSITFTLAGRQVNEIKHMIDIGKLIYLTAGGEWTISGDSAGIITPTEINPKQNTYNGSSDLRPLIIGGNALYVQGRGSIIRDLAFSFEEDGYRGSDLTIFSAHLVDGYTLTDWAYQQIPHSIVWAIRNDGVLLGLTYVKEQQMLGWHRHDTDGLFENVCAIPEGNEDSLYVTVKREIDGRAVRYIERINTRKIVDVVDNIFMDSAKTYDGRNTDETHTMTLSGGTNWDENETLTLTSSVSYFVASDVGGFIHMTGPDDEIIRFEITGFTGATIVTGRPNRTIPVDMRSVALSDWARAIDTVTGLWHLEGKDVSVFGDGFVEASPNNASYTIKTVSNGQLVLDEAYAVIHVGLPFISDIETLDIDTPNGETIMDKKKLVNKVTLFVESSKGIWIGSKPPTDDEVNPLENLNEARLRRDESYEEAVRLKTDSIDVNINSSWNSNGRVFVRQVDPVPLTVLAIAPAGLYPFRG